MDIIGARTRFSIYNVAFVAVRAEAKTYSNAAEPYSFRACFMYMCTTYMDFCQVPKSQYNSVW